MKKRVFSVVSLEVTLVVILLCGGCGHPVGYVPVSKRHDVALTTELYAPLAEIKNLSLATDVGNVTVTSADVDQCHIVARVSTYARTLDKAQKLAERVHVSAVAAGETLRIELLTPTAFGTNPFNTALTVVAPRRFALDCCTEVGDIIIVGFDNQIQAQTNVGNIVCRDLRAAIDLRTDVGNVRVAYASDAPAALDARAKTGVGDIDFNGPLSISATLNASVRRGSINSERALGMTEPVKRRLTASLGNAEGEIKLRITGKGSIDIR